MNSPQYQRHIDRTNARTYLRSEDDLWDRLQQPSILVPLLVLTFTFFYQSYNTRFSASSHGRQLGGFLWDTLVKIIPAALLFAFDNWLHPPLFRKPRQMPHSSLHIHAAKSEALRRIIGLDTAGAIMTTVAQAGRKSLSTISGSTLVYKKDTDQPAGLGNMDNSCFQNSILQGLASLKPFPIYLSAILDKSEVSNSVRDGSAHTLRSLIAQLNDTSNNGNTLWTPRKLKSLDTWQQQDAQEYFSKLLDQVDKEVAKVAKVTHKPAGFESIHSKDDADSSQHSDDSGYNSLSVSSSPEIKVVRNPLEGLMAQRVACTACGFSEGLSMIPFNCLTLNLGVDRSFYDVFERLDHYTHLEAIPGVECPKCTLLKLQRLLKLLVSRGRESGQSSEDLREPLSRLEIVEEALADDDFDDKTLTQHCKVKAQHRVSSTKTKQAVIARPPQSLALHVNRSVFDERTGHMFKNTAAVKFPSVLDLGPWCLGSADGQATFANARAEQPSEEKVELELDEEQWLSDPRVSMISGDRYPSRITGPLYELRAVVTHQGHHENGHYVCYRKHPRRPAKLEEQKAITAEEPVVDENGNADGDTEKPYISPQVDLAEEEPESQWWRLSDESVWEVSEEQVLAQGGVFMLFYDCVDPNSVLASQAPAGLEEAISTDHTDPKDHQKPPEDERNITALQKLTQSDILEGAQNTERTGSVGTKSDQDSSQPVVPDAVGAATVEQHQSPASLGMTEDTSGTVGMQDISVKLSTGNNEHTTHQVTVEST